MEVEKEIPKVLYFRNHKGTIHYDGIKLRCFACKSDTHLKKACPIIRGRQSAANKQQTPLLDDLEDSTPENNSEGKEDTVGVAAVESDCSKQKGMEATLLPDTKQRPSDSAAKPSYKEKANSSQSSESGIVPVSLSSKVRCRVASYYWIDDENERRLLIAEDKERIAKAMNTSMDKIDFFMDSL